MRKKNVTTTGNIVNMMKNTNAKIQERVKKKENITKDTREEKAEDRENMTAEKDAISGASSNSQLTLPTVSFMDSLKDYRLATTTTAHASFLS